MIVALWIIAICEVIRAIQNMMQLAMVRKDTGARERWLVPRDEAWWLVTQMDNYCCGYNEVEYNGKWYYTVHHA